MIGKIISWLIRILLVVAVCFFGYHYLTREELHSCVTTPLMSLNGKTDKIQVDEATVEKFMANFGAGLSGVVEKGGDLWENIKEASAGAEASGSGKAKLADELIDKGKYLYCKSVVDRVEGEK